MKKDKDNNQQDKKAKKFFCQGCEELFEKVYDDNGVDLCSECNDKYDNKTGYCSLSCCLGYGCDDTC